jgi:hypothetical protein
MGDMMPNLPLNKKRLQVEANSMRLNLDRFDLREMELVEEQQKLKENREATLKRIAELEKQIQEIK